MRPRLDFLAEDFFADDFRAPPLVPLAPVFAMEDRDELLVVLFFRVVGVLPARDELFRAALFAPRLVLLLARLLVLVRLLAVLAELPLRLLRVLLLLALFRPPDFVALLRDADLRRGAAADFEVLLREPVRRELLRDDFLAAMLYSGTRLDAFT